MNSSLVRSQAAINLLRIKSGALDPLVVKMQLERTLGVIDFQPLNLPKSSTLCIRTLADPLPGVLNVQRSDLPRPPSAWSRALATTLGHMVQHAARPALGVVPTNAQAVLFIDHAELLACLARDWLDGALTTHWWWRSLLGTRLWSQQAWQPTVLVAWVEAVEFVPTALDHLARQGHAIRFVLRLAPPEVQNLMHTIIHRFGLSALQAGLAQATEQRGEGAPDPPQYLANPAFSAAPWRAWTPEIVGMDLPPAHACLLGIALGLQRQPAAVRAPAFAQATANWLSRQSSRTLSSSKQGTAAPPLPGAMTISRLGEFEEVQSVDITADGAPRTSKPIAPPPAVEFERPAVLHPAVASAGTDNTASETDDLPTPGDSIQQEEQYPRPRFTRFIVDKSSSESLTGADQRQTKEHQPVPSRIKEPLPAATVYQGQAASERRTQPSLAAPEEELWTVETVSTNYGGLFYLINLGIYLGLYADFTAPLTPGLALNIYDFIALVGAELLGEGLCSDPVWPLLARLADRAEDEPPGHAFVPPDQLTLPLWLGQLVRTVRKRLQTALGLADADAPALAHLLLHQRARIALSAARLDIYFALDELPIAIRLSGLDRDPGWVPAAGRWVRFYYE